MQTGDVSTSLLLLLGGAGLLLLIACANVGALILVQALGRRDEIVMRRALGASQARLFTQMLCEGLVLAALGGAAALGVAEAAIRTLAARLPWDVPLAAPVALDGRVLLVTLLVALGASLVFGAVAWRPSRGTLTPARFRRRGWGREAVVVGELALTMLLLAGAGLLVRSLAHMEQQPLGFDPASRTLFQTQLPAGTATAGAAWAFDQGVLNRLNRLPGVQAAVTNMPPLAGQANLPGEAVGVAGGGASIEFCGVSTGYFAVMGMPLLAGRGFNAQDTAAAPRVGVINASAARHWFGGHALGRQVRMGAVGSQVWASALAAQPFTIVGFAGDVKVQDVRRSPRPTLFLPAAQATGNAAWWVVAGPVEEAQIRDAVAAVNANARVSGVETYRARIAATMARPAFEARLMSLFALLALLLAAVGLYGLLAYSVAQRTREIGIRMALGAQPNAAAWRVARRGLGLAVAGIGLGAAAIVPFHSLLAGLLYGVQPGDVAATAGAAAILLLAAAVACWLPARRATRVDVARALRVG